MEGKSACFKFLSKGGYVLGTQSKTIEKKREIGNFRGSNYQSLFLYIICAKLKHFLFQTLGILFDINCKSKGADFLSILNILIIF